MAKIVCDCNGWTEDDIEALPTVSYLEAMRMLNRRKGCGSCAGEVAVLLMKKEKHDQRDVH